MRRSLRRAGCLGLVTTVTLAAWAATGSARTSMRSAQQSANQQLRAAIVIPKSGPFSIHNRLIANGATVAAREINAQGASKGHPPIRLKLKVVTLKPTASPKSILRGLAGSSTRVLILPCNIELQESLARAAAKAGFLSLSPCNPDANLAKSVPRFWPTGTTGAAEAMQLAFYAQSYAHAKTAFVLNDHSWYGRQLSSELRTFAKREKIKIVGQATAPTSYGGIGPLAKRIRKLNPAVVFTTVPSPRVETIITQLRNWNVGSAFYVTDGMDAGINFLKYRNGPYNSSIEDVLFATFGFPRPGSGQFYRDYADAYGKKPVGSFPGLGYETLHVLETAAGRATALTPTALNAAFARGFTVPGVALEDISYRGHGHRQPVTDVGLAQVIRDGYVALFTSEAGHPTG
jgi:ABC-type branched-subunit amino acid transport system substrate-binding protein